MTITRKKDPGKEINVSKEAWEQIEKKLAKAAVEKKSKTSKKTTQKKTAKRTTKSEKPVKKPVNWSNWQTKKKTSPKKDSKSTSKNTEKNASQSKSIEDMVNELPDWFVELFEYLDKLDWVDVLSKEEKTEDHPKKRISSYSPRELERKLFLVFMASPKKVWNQASLKYERLLQKDFSIQAQISENSLSEWKKQDWFKDNHALVMKEIFKLRTPDVLNSLYEWATTNVNEWWKKDAAAIKLWLEYIEGFKPGMDVTTGGEKVEVYFWNGAVWKSQFINKNEKKQWESKE